MFRRRASEAKHEATVRDGGQGTGSARSGGPGSAAAGGPASSGAAAEPWGPPPAGLDVSAPHPARVWNYWLGGRDFFAADKAAGEEIGQEFPHLAEMARAERAFLVRAVRFLAGPARIRQYLDIGAGLPAGGNTHEIAQRIAPDSKIVYADNDPAVLLHAKALLGNPMLASTPDGAVCYTDADLRDVAAVLAGAGSALSLSRPVALIMLGVLGHVDDYGAARSIASQLMDALPAGSYLVAADGVAANQGIISAQRRYDESAQAAVWRQRARAVPTAPNGRADQLLRRPGHDRARRGAVPAVAAGRARYRRARPGTRRSPSAG